jgi:hypothetical protein|tara:strand:+ start:1054 stop:1290 length:237 start_codon:yes stop_codon:yes gene_type:complete
MRYTQYTHKVSIPMRKELYDFLSSLPRGARTDLGRQFFLIVQAMMHKGSEKLTDDKRYVLNKLTRGDYVLWLKETHET